MSERHDLAPPAEVRRIARRLEEAGFSTWAVGGAVRDALAGIPPGDWDLTTAARPADVRRIFRRTVPIGIEHGTVGVLGKDGHLYEVTTFRKDVETFGRRARVAFAATLEEDLERRDFTINAVAWHPLTGEVCDPHRGLEDLRRGVLRTVGDPAERFREDRLRVLRALRFAGRFRLRIEEGTWKALRAATPGLLELSAERVREELFKVLGGLETPSVSLQLYADSSALAVLYRELQACVGVQEPDTGEDIWTHLLRTVDAIPRHRTLLRLAALLHDVGKPPTREEREGTVHFPQHAQTGAALARDLLRRLKCSNAEIDRVTHLLAQHSDFPTTDAPDAQVRRWLRVVGRDYLRDLFRLRFASCRARAHAGAETAAAGQALLTLAHRARQLLVARSPLEISDLAIGGNELRALGIPRGPLYGVVLRDLLERVTDDPSLNTPEQLLAIVQGDIEGKEGPADERS